VYNI